MGKDQKDKKEVQHPRGGKGSTKSTGTKLKERWLLTRKTWRYMADAGKKLFPEGTAPNKAGDIPKVEDHFQRVCRRCSDFIPWNPHAKRGEPGPLDMETTHRYDSPEFDDDALKSPPGTDYSVENPSSPPPSDGAAVNSPSEKEELLSLSDISSALPDDLYNDLVGMYGPNTLRTVASRLFEDQLIEEDENEEDEGELIDVDGELMRSVGSQTDPHLDMCVQTDHDATAEDFVKVGAETKAETEAVVAHERAIMVKQGLIPPPMSFDEQKRMKQRYSQQHEHDNSESQHNYPHQQHHRPFHLQHAQPLQQQSVEQTDGFQRQAREPPVLKKFWSRRESTVSKNEIQSVQQQSQQEKDVQAAKGKTFAEKLASLEAVATHSGIGSAAAGLLKNQFKKPDSKKLIFKMGLKCDVEKAADKQKKEKTKLDMFKTINYDKTLSSIKSKWAPTPEEENFIRDLFERNKKERSLQGKQNIREQTEFEVKDKETIEKEMKEKAKKKKVKSIQVGEPLPPFILASLRIDSPVQIVPATRRLQRLSSKADSIDQVGSECTMSSTGSTPSIFCISFIDEQGNHEQDLNVTESDALKLSRMGIPFYHKTESTAISASSDASFIDGDDDFEAVGPTTGSGSGQKFSISAVQASSHIAQILYNLRNSRMFTSRMGDSVGGFLNRRRHHRLSHSLLQSILPTVMQRARPSSGGGGHSSRMVTKRIWNKRSRSTSRAAPGNTSIWTPGVNNSWVSITGRVSKLEDTTILNLTELERLTLQNIALTRLQEMNLGCAIKVPKEPESSIKKRRPYLLKKKALSSGLPDPKKEETRGTSGGLVFGLSISKCLDNERIRLREAAERDAISLAAEATAAAEENGIASRKCSRSGSHASFASLLDGTKRSTTGSLESLNLERKRPSVGSGDTMISGVSQDLLVVDSQPQVPSLVTCCCKHLENYGLHTLGIFRVSSSKKRARQLREEFDSGKEVHLNEDHCPHDVATLLKQFFRDLPEPLLTKELYEAFLETQKIRNRRLQIESLQYLVQLLPAPNRDTLHSLLTFLTTVAENSSDTISSAGELLQGNKMDSNNLATLFAPNILHQSHSLSETISSSEASAQACDRMDVINVVRNMIDHNKELFEIPPEVLNDTYIHLMDSHPEALDVILRRKCPPPEELDLEGDTNSSVFEGSEASSPMPRSPTEIIEFDKRRIYEEESKKREMREKRASIDASTAAEDRGWFRRREKSSSHETEENASPQERSRWFKRKDSTSGKMGENKPFSRQGSNKKTNGKCNYVTDGKDSVESASDRVINSYEISLPAGKLIVPEPSVRRLSSPEVNSCGIIKASLKIPVPLQQASLALSPGKELSYIDGTEQTQEEANNKLKDNNNVPNSRHRTGSNDSYLGQPITGTMSFQPLTKADSRQSHDSALCSSYFTMSPSERNTPNSDFLTSRASTPPSGAVSPPIFLSPDSGTPGLSPPNSPPPPPPPVQRRKGHQHQQQQQPRQREELLSSPKPIPMTNMGPKSFIAPLQSPKDTAPPYKSTAGAPPVTRAKTLEQMRLEDSTATSSFGRSTNEVRRRNDQNRNRNISDQGSGGGGGGGKEAAVKKYNRKRYIGEKHHSDNLPDISDLGVPPFPGERTSSSTGQTISRRDLIASDPTGPETFV